MLEDDEHDHSFDNISMAIDRLDSVTEVKTKFFSKISGADVHATLEALDLELIWKRLPTYFFMDNQMCKCTLFGCSVLRCKDLLLKLMSRYMCEFSWKTLDMCYLVIMFSVDNDSLEEFCLPC